MFVRVREVRGTLGSMLCYFMVCYTCVEMGWDGIRREEIRSGYGQDSAVHH